jgi:acetoin utilization protein AcuB
MGLRGLVTRSVHDMERERRNTQVLTNSGDMQRRAEEKIREILRDQQGDMSAFAGDADGADNPDADICSLHVGKIMSSNVAVLSFDDNLLTVQGIFSKVKFRHLPVVEDDGSIIGIISDRDYLRMESPFFGTVNEQTRDSEIMHRKVGTIMTRNPICAYVDTNLMEAVNLMNDRKISCLPVVDRDCNRLLGIVTWKDVVRAFCPDAFNRANDSNRLKSGVKINPQSAESARLRVKAAQSARLRARTDIPPSPPSGKPVVAPPSARTGETGVRSDTGNFPPPGKTTP